MTLYTPSAWSNNWPFLQSFQAVLVDLKGHRLQLQIVLILTIHLLVILIDVIRYGVSAVDRGSRVTGGLTIATTAGACTAQLRTKKQRIFHRLSMVMEKALLKWVPVFNDTNLRYHMTQHTWYQSIQRSCALQTYGGQCCTDYNRWITVEPLYNTVHYRRY